MTEYQNKTIPEMRERLLAATTEEVQGWLRQLAGTVVHASKDPATKETIQAFIAELEAKCPEAKPLPVSRDAATLRESLIRRGLTIVDNPDGSWTATQAAPVLQVPEAPEVPKVDNTPLPEMEDPEGQPAATEAAIRLALEAGVDLRLVPFDGKQVTKPNVEKYIEGQKSLERQA